MLGTTWSWMLQGLVAAAVWLFILWLIQVKRRDAGVVDLGWTIGVGMLAVYFAARGEGWLIRRVLAAAMIGLWSFRLAYYILTDRVLSKEEDGRYQRMRAYWGEKANFYFFFFFVCQSILVVLFAAPLLPAVMRPQDGFGVADFLGILVWIVAIGGEGLADRQLQRFRADPANRGKTCREGLWRYSRHPNYFFEWVHWWAYVLLGIGGPTWWMTLIGPIVMFLFLFFLTGIPYTEQQALSKRGDDYRDYQRTTSMFFPLPPRKSS